MELQDLIKKARANVRFTYLGGGYFRDKNVPMAKLVNDGKGGKKLKSEKAEIVHGNEILDEFCKELLKQNELTS